MWIGWDIYRDVVTTIKWYDLSFTHHLFNLSVTAFKTLLAATVSIMWQSSVEKRRINTTIKNGQIRNERLDPWPPPNATTIALPVVSTRTNLKTLNDILDIAMIVTNHETCQEWQEGPDEQARQENVLGRCFKTIARLTWCAVWWANGQKITDILTLHTKHTRFYEKL